MFVNQRVWPYRLEIGWRNQWSVINGERCGERKNKQLYQVTGRPFERRGEKTRATESKKMICLGSACAITRLDWFFPPSYRRDRTRCDGCERNVPSPSDAHRSHPFPMIYLAGGRRRRRTLTEQIDNMADQPHTAHFPFHSFWGRFQASYFSIYK